MNIRIHSIEKSSFVDGPGERTVVFLQGCPIHCKGCQNQALWPADGGQVWDVADLARELVFNARKHGNITISGGEPFAQIEALANLVFLVRNGLRVWGSDQPINIQIYSGYTLEQLLHNRDDRFVQYVWSILMDIDVLVDGPFIANQDDDFVVFRGSRNQRVINVPETMKNFTVNLTREIALLDWDNIEITIAANGDAYMPAGMADEFKDIGKAKSTRRCGERNRKHGNTI